MKKVLILSYYYPPMGGIGVQRVSKTVKYLPYCGYSPIVVAGSERQYNKMYLDKSMLSDVNKAITYRVELTNKEIRKSQLYQKKFIKHIPGLSLKIWINAANRVCQKAVQSENPDLIYVTVSPFETVKIVESIAEKYHLPWIIDMRDPWALDPIAFYTTWLHYRNDLAQMNRFCQKANAIIMNTSRALEAFQNKFPNISKNKLFCVTNGWDQDDFQKEYIKSGNRRHNQALTIVHTGRFHTSFAIDVDLNIRKIFTGKRDKKIINFFKYSSSKPNLLSRTPYYLFKAIEKLLRETSIKEEDLNVIFIGNISEHDINLATECGLMNIVKFKGTVSHNESIQYLLNSDVLLLPLHVPSNGKLPLIVPGKTYEYMAAKKPILALVPPGNTQDFIRQSGLGYLCSPTDIETISQTLLKLIKNHKTSKGILIEPNEEFIQQFERKIITQKIADVFNFVIDN